ncbi:MAG: tetratricopeptide repeat protein [Gemmatimonadota bacterium]|jgi:predicted negative regulator of RcsB-dependent stress response
MPGAVAPKKRREEGSREDAILVFLETAAAWARVHTRVVISVLVAIGLLVGGVFYYRSYRQSLRAAAAIELNQLRGTLTPADAIPRLTGFIARFEGTPSAVEGRLLLARLQLRTREPQAAIQTLDPILSEPTDRPTGYAVAILLAESYKEVGEPDRSLAKLDEIIRDAYVPYQRHRALAERGRLLAELGRLEEAAATYERLTEEEGATDDLYRVRLGEIEALIASGTDPTPSAFAAPKPPAPSPEDPEAAAADDAEATPASDADDAEEPAPPEPGEG